MYPAPDAQAQGAPSDPAEQRCFGSAGSEAEGHAVPIIYAALADLGADIGKNKAESRPMTKLGCARIFMRDPESLPIDGHPNPQLGVHFFDAATGSLGQGLSVAAGLGAAARMDKIDRNIYCIIGDGESREGQIWEAADFVVDRALTNVVPIFNCNDLAQSDYVSPQQSYQGLADKLHAFGFIVRVIDGHDPRDIISALNELHVIQNGKRPLAIVARTVKGWGAPDEQGMGKHGTPVKKDKMATIFGELDRTAKDLGVADYKFNGELKIAAITGKGADDRSKADQDQGVCRRTGNGGIGQGSCRGKRYRSTKGIWGGAGCAG